MYQVDETAVYAVLDNSKQAVMLKGSDLPALGYFASALFANLGVRTPATKILGATEHNKEIKELLYGIEWALKSVPQLKRTAKVSLTKDYILAQELVNGLSLKPPQVGKVRLEHIFGNL